MAAISAQVSVSSNSTPVLLWQTTSGQAPDHAVDSANQYFRAGTFNDPIPIVLVNLGANTAYLGGSGANSTTGTPLYANNSLAYNVVGNDSLYGVIAASNSTTVAVLVNRQ